MKKLLIIISLFYVTLGLVGCSNSNDRFNVRNSWCSEQITPTVEQLTLSADILFLYNDSSLDGTSLDGKAQLAKLVSHLNENNLNNIKSIKIVGYTDRIGSTQYNDKLGLARAETIKQYLEDHNIQTEYIIESKGKEDPISDGCFTLSGDELKACLQPDRRVQLYIEREN
ncbi:OmpA family protein [Orbus sturtevantii]|uniref:OmpA family protein n=1 Tax=Orbus sturtevantii TaxID=3074109 RepID=UPI00370D5638